MNQPRKLLNEAERKQLVELASIQLFQDDKESKEALDYLLNVRKFNKEILKEFEIGYVPYHAKNDEGNTHELAGKIVYPIYNQHSELVAVSSRNWRQGAKQKFWHESFEKPFYLYGFHIAKKHIIKYRKAILVEGEHDTMSMHKGGIKVTCGILGSAPQMFHLGLLMRYCDEIYTLFDSDKAGNVARESIQKMFEEYDLKTYGVDLYNAKLPSAKLPSAKELSLENDKDVDPDFYIKKFGAKAVMKIINETKTKEMEKCQAV